MHSHVWASQKLICFLVRSVEGRVRQPETSSERCNLKFFVCSLQQSFHFKAEEESGEEAETRNALLFEQKTRAPANSGRGARQADRPSRDPPVQPCELQFPWKIAKIVQEIKAPCQVEWMTEWLSRGNIELKFFVPCKKTFKPARVAFKTFDRLSFHHFCFPWILSSHHVKPAHFQN